MKINFFSGPNRMTAEEKEKAKKKLLNPLPSEGKRRKIYSFIKFTFREIQRRINESLRLELLVLILFCFICATAVGSFMGDILKNSNRAGTEYIDYSSGMERIDKIAQSTVNSLTNQKVTIDEKDHIESILEREAENENVALVDLEGNVIAKIGQETSTKIDVYKVIQNAMKTRVRRSQREIREVFYSFYPVEMKGFKGYIIASGIPQATIMYTHSNDTSKAMLLATITFITIFLLMTKRKIRYIEEISKGLIEISKGNLEYQVQEKGKDELALLAQNINFMEMELKNKIDQERKADKVKNELITNVSHDLRTPLTSIMGYIGLLKEKKYQDMNQAQEYLNIAYTKSEKLKTLIEDLFEYTKLTNEGIRLNMQRIALNEFLEQLLEEVVPICEENQIITVKEFPKEKLMLYMDPDKMLRVFENLITNAVKYSFKPGSVLLKIWEEEDRVYVMVENKGDHLSEEDLEKIFDRFYRVEKSRASSTGGSGLGLAISKNIVRLHQGEIWAECEEETIRFFVKLKKEMNR